MKACTKCGNKFPADEFSITSGWCKQCKRAHDNERYANNPARKAQVRAAAKVTRNKKAQYLWDYLLSHPCVGCGETDPIVLQFDHRDGVEKSGNLSNMTQFAWATIKAEIEKCDIRCANCHQRRTAIQFGWYAFVAQR